MRYALFDGGDGDPKKKVHIEDTRKVSGATGQPIETPRTGDFDEDVVRQIIKAAKEEGVNPYNALAVAFQETGFGTKGTNAFNYGQVNYSKINDDPDKLNYMKQRLGDLREMDNPEYNARALAAMLKYHLGQADKMGYTDDAMRLQAYNGYRKVGGKNDIGAKKLYGIDLTKNVIDMSKTPLYGKTIVDVRDNLIKPNPDIQKLIGEYFITPQQQQVPLRNSGMTIQQ